MENTVTVRAEDLGALLQKVDALSAQVAGLTEQVEAQRRGQLVVEELVQDALPVFNSAFKAVTREMVELEGAYSVDEVVAVLKRVLVNTHRLNQALGLLEAGVDLLDEVQLLSRPVFATATQVAGELERKGYLVFAQEGLRMADRVVTEFTPDDARALADNVVTILKTVKNMTQPDIMALANNAVDQLHEPEPAGQDVSVWSLMRDLNDPKVRKGLARLLRVLKSLSDQPAGQN